MVSNFYKKKQKKLLIEFEGKKHYFRLKKKLGFYLTINNQVNRIEQRFFAKNI